MLCQLAVLNVRNSKLLVKDNVRSECYWYAHNVYWGCALRVFYTLGTLFPESMLHTGAGRHYTRSLTEAILTV